MQVKKHLKPPWSIFPLDPKKTEENEEDVRKTKKPQKRPASAAKRKASPGKPNNYSKLDDKERERLFLNTYDENLRLKKKETELTNDFKMYPSGWLHDYERIILE